MVYPHQLFDPKQLGSVPGPIFLIEDGLFFGDHIQGWTPHKQKLWLHRSSMKRYARTVSARDAPRRTAGGCCGATRGSTPPAGRARST